MVGPGDDIIKEINSGATDRVLQKKYSLSGDEVKAFRNLHYALSSDKMTKDEIPDYYPELKNYFSTPAAPVATHENAAPPTEQSQPISAAAESVPAGDYTKPVVQKSVAESSGIAAPTERRNDFLQEQQRERRVHEKYDPIVKGAFGEINSDKKRFLTGSRPALEDHPEMPAGMYQHLNMPEVDRYLKESIPNPEDRYYVRNQLKNQFEAGKDQYHTDEIAQQKIMQLPAFQQAEQQVKKELGDKLLGVSKDAYLKQVVQKAAQIDPALQEQVSKVYGQAQQDQQVAKNEAIRNEMNNTWAGKSLAAKMPFHDQVTGAAKALQGFFKYSGQVGQMASDLLDIIPSKATKEAAYSLRNNAEGFIEQNKFPEGAQTLPEFAGGELLPMMAQGAAFGKLAHFAGAPIYKALAGAKAAGTIGKFAEGAIGGMATAPINSYIISHDYYNSLVKNGETPEIAQAKAEEVFNKNLVTDMAISPLQFGIMNLPIKNAAGLLLKPSLSAATSGVHMMLQDYYQQKQNNPALHLMDYMVSPEGLRTGFIGAGVGLMQHYVIGKMNNWKSDNWTKNAFAFSRKYGAKDDRQLPSNHAIAATALSAMEMKDTPGRAAELHDLVNELHQNGVYDGPQAQRIKDIINDVAAVKDNPLLKTGTPAQRMAIFNELLQRKAYDDASKDNDTIGKYLTPAIENSDIRIARILNNDEPLYFINGYETGKEQLLKAVRDNPELLNQNIGIKVVNDPATKQEILSLKNTHNGQTETKADAETQERGLGQQGAAGEHIMNEEKSAAPSHENIRQVIDTAIKDKKIEGMLAESAQRDPEAFLKMIADQAHGITDTGHQAAGENAEAAARAQVGDDIVDLAKKLYPSPQTENNAETTTGERGPLPATEKQADAQTGDTQPGSPGGSDRPEEIRQNEVLVPGSPRQEINEPGPSKEEVTPERKLQREYAYKNSYPEFKKKYPEVSTDEYNQLRSEQRKALIQKVSEPTPAQTEAYSTGIGVKPNTMTGRVPVDPIVGQSPKELKKMIADVSGALKQRTFFTKSGRRNSLGSYAPSSTAIKITFNGDLDTTAHELGHSMDDKFGIYNAAAGNPAALHEMSQLAEHGGSTPPSGHKNPIKYTLQEGIAEWVRAYIANPKAAIALAPEMHKLYQERVSAQWKKGIETFSIDFRTWAGSVGRDQTLSNVEFVPNKKPNALQELFKKEEANNEFGINWTDKLAANYINPLHAFEKAFRYARGIKDITDVLPQNDPIILSRVLRGIDAKFGDILETGMIDARMNLLKDADGNNKNLQWLLDPLDNTDQASIERDMKDTIAYMVAERTAELALRFGRDEILTGIGGGIFSDVDVAVKTLNEFKTGDPNRLQRIEKAAVRYREFADGTLQYMVDKGRLSSEQYQQIKDDNLYYVGLQRVLETAPNQEIIVFSGPGGNLGAKGEPLHKIKGSTKAINNPYVSLLDTLYKTMKESDRNEVMQAFRDMIDEPRSMSEGQPLRYADIGIRVPEGTDMSIPIFVNGKKENWLFQEDIYKALKGLDHDGFQLPWYLTAHAQVLRFTTTHFPTFAVRNWIKDTQDRLIKSNEGGWTGMVTGQGFKDLVGPSEDWQAVARAGGLNSGKYFKDRTYYYGLLKEAMTGMAKDKRFILADPTRLKEVWHKYEDLLYKSETSNRVAEYRSAMREGKKKGMDDYNAMLYAGYKARDLVDFAVAGHHMRLINQIVPFSNAAVQGIRSTVLRAQENPLQFAARMSIYSILPGMAAWWLNHRDEDTGKEYEELPHYQRDMFWNFKIGDNKWLSMPKPYELSVSSAGIDRLMSQQLTDNQHAFEGYAGDVAKSLLPFDAGNLSGPGQPFVESRANYDFFRDKYIIPPDEDALKLSLRHTEAGSRLGQLVQQAAGIDARKADHFIESQFSYMGRFAVKASDIGKKSSKHVFDLTDTGLGRRSPAYSAPSVQRLLTYAKDNGLMNNKQFKQFKAHAAAYFSAGTDKEKQQLGNELIDHAKYLLDAWEEAGKAEEKQQKVDAKKAASE